MARLKSHGRELIRITRQRNLNNDSSIVWERQTRAYMADGKVLEKRDVQFKPTHFRPDGEFYSYGWKLYGRLKDGVNPEQHSETIRQRIATGEWKTWAIASSTRTNGRPNHRPVLIPQSRIVKAVQSDSGIGFCRECGQRQTSYVDPDSRNQMCDNCGEYAVYGAQEMLFDSVG